MILRILVGSVLALSAVNALAGNMYIYKDKGGQVLLTKVNTSSDVDKFTKKVKVTYYRDSQSYGENKSSQKQEVSKEKKVTYGSSSDSDSSSTSYADSAYLALR